MSRPILDLYRKRSSLQFLKNSVHRDQSWHPFSSTSRSLTCQPSYGPESMHLYADNLAIMHADGDWQAVEGVLSKDMATVGESLQTWKLKLSTTKLVLPAFHLNRKLNVS